MSAYILRARLDSGYQGLSFAHADAADAGLRQIHRWIEGPVPLTPDAVPRLSRQWTPLEVQVIPPAGRPSDFPDLAGLPAFSGRAVTELRDLLEDAGELLPLNCRGGEFWAYNPTVVADAMDRNRSEVIWIDPRVKNLASRVVRYEFRPEALHGLTIFRLPECLGELFVTDFFRDRAVASRLEGMELARIWPIDTESIREKHRRKRQRR